MPLNHVFRPDLLGLIGSQYSRLSGSRDTAQNLYGCAETESTQEEYHQLSSVADVCEYCWPEEEEVRPGLCWKMVLQLYIWGSGVWVDQGGLYKHCIARFSA